MPESGFVTAAAPEQVSVVLTSLGLERSGGGSEGEIYVGYAVSATIVGEQGRTRVMVAGGGPEAGALLDALASGLQALEVSTRLVEASRLASEVGPTGREVGEDDLDEVTRLRPSLPTFQHTERAGLLAQHAEGDRVAGPDGVSFTYQVNVPDMVASTIGEGFGWRWILVGRVGLPVDGEAVATFDGRLVVGVSSTSVHALVSQIQSGTATYATGPRNGVHVVGVGSVGLFTKRPRSLLIDLPGGVTVGTIEVAELTPSGTRLRFKKEAAFAGQFGNA